MATEVEIKFKVDDHAAVRERLRALGAIRRGERFEINAFFDAGGMLKAAGNGLRLRSMRDEAGAVCSVITFKGPASGDGIKSREEIEFSIGNFDDAAALLARLGYLPTLSFEKRRETWAMDGCLVELDELPLLGKFVEIEGSDVVAIQRIRDLLELASAAPVEAGYASMVGRLIATRPDLGAYVRFETP